MRRTGFTIIELAVVIALVLVLAAILYPAFLPKGGHGGRRASCQSNLKLIALGFKQYIQDNEAEAYPVADDSRSGLDSTDNWIGRIMPYMKSQQITQCPTDERARDEEKSSYGYNAWMSNRAEAKVKAPAYVVLNFEVTADPNNWTQTGTGPQAVSASTRHVEGSNFSFVDGHVKWYKPGGVGAGPTSQGKPTFFPG